MLTMLQPFKSYQNVDGSREWFESLFDVIFADINFSSAVLLTRRKHSITLQNPRVLLWRRGKRERLMSFYH